jgi:glycopeptide antibiotics resistance protein
MPNRIRYFTAISITIILGLASRKFSATDSWVHLYMGDVLWTMLFYFCFRFLWIHKTLTFSLLFAIVWSFLIEISQLYHPPWLDAVRNTTLGGLLLGFGFLWTDLVSYVIGAFLGYFIDTRISRMFTRISPI